MQLTRDINQKYIYILIGAGIFWLDQFSKMIVFAWTEQAWSQTGQPQIYLTSFFNLTRVWNSGVSFGLLNNLAYKEIILSLASLIIMSFIIFCYRHTTKKLDIIGLVCIISGAIGNLSDRIRFGAVADFLDFHWYQYHWPSFNVADMAVCFGVLLLIISEIPSQHT